MTRRSLSNVEQGRTKGLVAGGVLQRKCACGKNTAGGGECGACSRAHGQPQRKSAGATQDAAAASDSVHGVPDTVREVLSAAGSPLEPQTRALMESRFGHGFGHVRVHTDAKAEESAHALQARAYTVGSDIVFAGPSPARDHSTLAHELTHVLQQSRGIAPQSGELRVSPPDTAQEHEADRVARDVLSGDARGPSARANALSPAAPTSIQRQPNKTASPPPPHKLETFSKSKGDPRRLSDAVMPDFRAAAAEVKNETGVDIMQLPGGTTREIGSKTTKVGADNFSWHKTGRAVDISQKLHWLIIKEGTQDDVHFRLFLEKKPDKTKKQAARYDRKFDKANPPDVHHSPFKRESEIYKKTFVDVTQILQDHGFRRIDPQKGWEKVHDKQEWWHFEKRGGLTMYKALREIYNDDEIAKGFTSVTGSKKSKHSPATAVARMHREGFPDSTIQKVSPKTTDVKREVQIGTAQEKLDAKEFEEAAPLMEKLDVDDIDMLVKKLKKKDKQKLHDAALSNKSLGAKSKIATHTEP